MAAIVLPLYKVVRVIMAAAENSGFVVCVSGVVVGDNCPP